MDLIERQKYIDYSMAKTKYHYKKKNIENEDTGLVSEIKYNFIDSKKDDFSDILRRTDCLVNEINSSNKDLMTFFITLNLPDKYHPFIQDDNNEYIENINYNSGLTINAGYKRLNTMMRKIQKDMRVCEYPLYKKHTFKFVKVIEHNEYFIPYLHSVIFVEQEYVEQFKRHLMFVFGLNVEDVEEGIEIASGKYVYGPNEYIGISELEEFKDVGYAVEILLKDIRKTFNLGSEFDKYLLDGWKKMNKIRNFTMSNI